LLPLVQNQLLADYLTKELNFKLDLDSYEADKPNKNVNADFNDLRDKLKDELF